MNNLKAIKCEQNNRCFFLTVLKVSVLKNVCYVAHRDEDPQEGFQRTLVKSRAQDIAKYILSGESCIPSVLILSVHEDADFSFDETSSTVNFEDARNTFMVLDGQHRLFGLIIALEETKRDFDIPVVIFSNLSIKQEVNLFIDINTTQKGVPTALLIDIKNLAGRETDIEAVQRYLFDSLNENSVLAGKFSPISSKQGFIAKSVFNEATKPLLMSGYFSEQEKEVTIKGLRNYLEAVNSVFKESKSKNAKLTTSNLFKAAFEIFNDVIDKSFKDYGDLKIASLINVLEPIASLQYDNYTGTNRSALKKIVLDMKSALNGYSKKYQDIDSSLIF